MSQVHCDVTPVWFSLGLKAYFYGQCKAGAEFIWVRIVNLTVMAGKVKPFSPTPGYPYQLFGLPGGPLEEGLSRFPCLKLFLCCLKKDLKSFHTFSIIFFPSMLFFFVCVSEGNKNFWM